MSDSTHDAEGAESAMLLVKDSGLTTEGENVVVGHNKLLKVLAGLRSSLLARIFGIRLHATHHLMKLPFDLLFLRSKVVLDWTVR